MSIKYLKVIIFWSVLLLFLGCKKEEDGCSSNSDCKTGERCFSGSCIIMSSSDGGSCQPGEESAVTCTASDECQAGEICSSGRCIFNDCGEEGKKASGVAISCKADRDCQLGEVCNYSRCVFKNCDGSVSDGGVSDGGGSTGTASDGTTINLRVTPTRIYTGGEESEVVARVFKDKKIVPEGTEVIFQMFPNPGKEVAFFKSDSVGSGKIKLKTNKEGEARVIVVSGQKPGGVNIVASSGTKEEDTRLVIEVRPRPVLQFVSAIPGTIGIKGSSKDVPSIVTFSIKDRNGQPFPDGEKIKFWIQDPCELKEPPPANCPPRVANLDPPINYISGGKGQVSTNLRALGVVGTLQITASYTDPKTNIEYTVPSPPIAIVNGVPSHKGLSLVCTKQNIQGLPWQSLVNRCCLVVKDRDNAQADEDLQVQFFTEAGSFPQKVTTDKYGEAVAELRTSNSNDIVPDNWGIYQSGIVDDIKVGNTLCLALSKHRPKACQELKDVIDTLLTNTGNPSLTSFISQCGNQIKDIYKKECKEPLQFAGGDGLVTVIAVTDGEEIFTEYGDAKNNYYENYKNEPLTIDKNNDGCYAPEAGDVFDPAANDTNGNGIWDGECFVDLPEPFVDKNNNAICDTSTDTRLNEFYIDSNSNGEWDNGNGKWDNSSVIWVSNRMRWSGVCDTHFYHSHVYIKGEPQMPLDNRCKDNHWETLLYWFGDKNFGPLIDDTEITVGATGSAVRFANGSTRFNVKDALFNQVYSIDFCFEDTTGGAQNADILISAKYKNPVGKIESCQLPLPVSLKANTP